ncbi:MAG: DUF58 domain-containing protein, partial [Anaerolineales bacterium]|nr:DUF58 domain-containing protein [Anaerolineales bacterium]
MTKTGFGFIIAGLLVYLLASQTQIGWLYLFDAIIWSLLVLSAILPWWSLRTLQMERQVLMPSFTLHQSQLGGPREDETIEVRLKVTNRGRLTRYLIKVVEESPFAEPERQHRAFLLTSLKPKSTVVFSYTATCYYRGYYTASRATLQSSGLLGLMIRRRIFPLPLKLTVYPTYYQMEGLPVTEAALTDWGHAARSRSAAEFYGSREHRLGEPLKHIHWRNTARLGHFMLKEFEQAGKGSVAVIFPTRLDFGTGRETTLEYSIRIAASLAKLAEDSGRNIDIIAGKNQLRNASWQEAMDYLARLQVDGKAGLSELTAVAQPGQVVVVVAP